MSNYLFNIFIKRKPICGYWPPCQTMQTSRINVFSVSYYLCLPAAPKSWAAAGQKPLKTQKWMQLEEVWCLHIQGCLLTRKLSTFVWKTCAKFNENIYISPGLLCWVCFPLVFFFFLTVLVLFVVVFIAAFTAFKENQRDN